MHASILFMPIPMAAAAILSRIAGQKSALNVFSAVGSLLYSLTPFRTEFAQNDLKQELRFLHHIPWTACFERACALQIWLAGHGEKSSICLGTRIEHGHILGHAWVETESAKFYYDARFLVHRRSGLKRWAGCVSAP